MNNFPFHLPDSLVSYAIQFESSPHKAINRLKLQLDKRGPDPVGYFLLGWFYHRQNEKQQAIDCAFKAKNLASGSPFLKNIHYFFTHPDVFEAWQLHPEPPILKQNAVLSPSSYESVQQLDLLIEKLANFEDKQMNANLSGSKNKESSVSIANELDDIASDTLAEIHQTQGEIDAAIEVYQKLTKSNKSKKKYYNEKIAKLKEMKKKAGKS